MRFCVTLALVSVVHGTSISQALQGVADLLQAKYNMSISLSYHNEDYSYSVASGFTDAGIGLGVPHRAALPDDIYVWGRYADSSLGYSGAVKSLESVIS